MKIRALQLQPISKYNEENTQKILLVRGNNYNMELIIFFQNESLKNIHI